MNSPCPFPRSLALSCVLHLAALLVVLLSVAFAPTKKFEPIQWINPSEFQSLASPALAPEPPRPQPPEPPRPRPSEPPKPEPTQRTPPPSQARVPDPPKPVPAPQLQPKPEITPVPKKPQPPIKVSKKLVTRPVQAAGAPSKTPQPSVEEDFKRRVTQRLQEVRVGSAAPSPVGRPDQFAWYYALVRDEMYANWTEPGLTQTLTAQAVIRVARDGRVQHWRLTLPCGNAMMDVSVQNCLQAVKKLPPLPAGLGGETADIMIEFKLQGGF